MPRNDALRNALLSSDLTAADLAERCEVDPKTVERWVSRGRVPHPRHRVRAAAALGENVDVLWPEIVRRNAKTGADRELMGLYPRRSDLPRSLFRDLIERAQARLWLGGYTNYFVWLDTPGAADTLGRKAQAGADVRILLGDPDSSVTTERDQIEDTPLTLGTRIALTRAEIAKAPVPLPARLTDRHIAMSVWIFDDDVIVSTHIGPGLGQDSVTMHLQRRQTGGPVDRYVEHYESLWAAARKPSAE